MGKKREKRERAMLLVIAFSQPTPTTKRPKVKGRYNRRLAEARRDNARIIPGLTGKFLRSLLKG